jgi:Putative Actinobacterial Holin-X, holin superfamily III
MAYEADASIGGLVRGALEDVRELFREEVALARAEIRQELSKATAAAFQFGVAGGALMFALGCFVVALALGIAAAFDWPAWAGFGIVAVVLAVVGAVAYSAGRRAVSTVQPLPRTVHTMKENFR